MQKSPLNQAESRIRRFGENQLTLRASSGFTPRRGYLSGLGQQEPDTFGELGSSLTGLLPRVSQNAAPDRSGWAGVDRTPRRGYTPQRDTSFGPEPIGPTPLGFPGAQDQQRGPNMAAPALPVRPSFQPDPDLEGTLRTARSQSPAYQSVSSKPVQLRAYQTAAPGTTSEQNDKNAWAGVTPQRIPTFAESNAAYSAQQLGGAQASGQPWKSFQQPTRAADGSITGMDTKNVYKQGNSYTDRPVAMADGGELQAENGFFSGLRKTLMPSDADRAAHAQYLQDSAPRPTAQAPVDHAQALRSGGGNWGNIASPEPAVPAPTQRRPNGLSMATNVGLQKLGLKRGGDLRTGMGGAVPGTGSGDKIDAKYEPGEFVVSNDMLEAQPGLRESLRDLRAEVLADKGMTVEQADAKALTGKGLRAQDAFGSYINEMDNPPKTLDEIYARGVESQAPRGATINDAYAKHVGVQQQDRLNAFNKKMGVGAAPAAAPPAPPVAAPAAAAAPEPGWYNQGKKLAGAARFVGRTLPVLGGGYELGTGMDEGDGWKMAKGAGDIAAGAALGTLAAPVAAGYLGLRGLYEGAKGVASLASNYALRDKDQQIAAMLKGDAPRAAQPNGRTAGDDLQARNQAMLTRNQDDWNKLNPAAELGATRNADHSGNLLADGQEMVYTGPKMGWQQRTSAQGHAKLDADRMRWAEDEKYNAAQAQARIQTIRDEMAPPLRPFEKELQNSLRIAQLRADTDKQTNAATNKTSLEMNENTNLRNRETAMIPFQIAQRQRQNLAMALRNSTGKEPGATPDYGRARDMLIMNGMPIDEVDKALTSQNAEKRLISERVDKDLDNRRAETKGWDDHASTLFQTTDKETGKSIPDARRIADFTDATDATVREMAKSLSSSKDPAKQKYGELLAKNGRAALDEADRANMLKRFKIMELHRGSYSGLNPLASSGAVSNDLRNYANMTPQKGNWLQPRMEMLNEDKKPTGASIPNVNLDYGPDANYILPNLRQTNQSLR